ncbi:MAG: hypothetical protein KAT70_05150, partial [Thermoplasmata archaeon]|nr:hypothetical protein [Thermoplasmata archaeon]
MNNYIPEPKIEMTGGPTETITINVTDMMGSDDIAGVMVRCRHLGGEWYFLGNDTWGEDGFSIRNESFYLPEGGSAINVTVRDLSGATGYGEVALAMPAVTHSMSFFGTYDNVTYVNSNTFFILAPTWDEENSTTQYRTFQNDTWEEYVIYDEPFNLTLEDGPFLLQYFTEWENDYLTGLHTLNMSFDDTSPGFEVTKPLEGQDLESTQNITVRLLPGNENAISISYSYNL